MGEECPFCNEYFGDLSEHECGSPQKRDYGLQVHCLQCRRTESLTMFAHRDEDERLVGWVFVCEWCAVEVANKHIQITLLQPTTEPKHEHEIDNCAAIKENIIRMDAEKARDHTRVVELEEENERLRKRKDGAYTERNQVISLLSSIFPSHLCIHDPSDNSWDEEWRTIVCIHSPNGQLTWHLHNNHVHLFNHLEMGMTHWDGHDTEEKYRRIDDLRRRITCRP